jgi:hypothetical protein
LSAIITVLEKDKISESYTIYKGKHSRDRAISAIPLSHNKGPVKI